MKNRIISTGIVGLLVICGFLGLFAVTNQARAPGPTYVSGSITLNTIWYQTDSPFIVTGDVTVEPGVTLTIEPGVEVKFDGLYSLIVNGTLIAQGTPGSPILFTSNQGVPAKGDWHRIRLHGANNIMDYCEISFGDYPLYIMCANTKNRISNCKISNNTGDGIYLKETSGNIIYNTTVTSSYSNGITLLISEYNIINKSFVNQNRAFGIYVRSSSNNTIMNTYVSKNTGGGIELGLNSSYIEITNVTVFENQDNGIDFNGNGNNNIADSRIIGNDGTGIDLGCASENQWIENCIIRDNDGSGIDLEGSLYVDIMDCNISKNKGNAGIYSGDSVSNITIKNSEIWNNSEDGIELYGATYVNITDSNISENGLNGIIFNGSEIQENNTIQNCTISGNENNGIYFYVYSTDSTLNLQYNNIYSNKIYSNTQNGIYFKTFADRYCRHHSYIQYNNIFINTIYSNNRNGIYFNTYAEEYTYSPYFQYNCIHNNTINSNNQNGIYFEVFSYSYTLYISYNKVNNNSIYSNNKNGIHFNLKAEWEWYYFQYNNIFNNTIYSNSQNGIFFNTSYIPNECSYFRYNNIYSNTIFSNNQNGIFFHCYGVDGSYFEYNNIYSNTIHSNDQNGIYLFIHTRWYVLELQYNNIHSNIIHSNNQNGLYIYVFFDSDRVDRYAYFQYNDIYSNTIYSNDQNGIYMYGNSRTGNLYVQDNFIYSNTISLQTNGSGIYAQSDNTSVSWENSHLYKNTIFSNLIGIKLLRIDSHIVYINNISNNLNDGVLLDSTNSSTISYNKIANNNWSAINITNSSHSNKIQNNNITSNNQTGIFVNGNSNINTIIRNDIMDHPELGMNITDSVDNIVHHNNFKNNLQNAHDSTTQLNDWDDSAEGNWWDDYTGFDANEDGIGDIPYDVPGGGSKDWYPLIEPANITAPHVENTTPEDGDLNISVTPLISITFSIKMNLTATENAITISGGLTPTNFSWSNGEMTVSFEPSSTLSSLTIYIINIMIDAKDVLGNQLKEPYQFSFTTKDVVEPTIILTSPEDDYVDIALNKSIVVMFSEPMNITTVSYTCSPNPGGWDVSWSNMNSVATYTHDDFGSKTTYLFEITSGKDIGGNDLVDGPVQNPWSFTTLDVVGPEITSTSPADGSENDTTTAAIVVYFNEQMDTTSVTYACSPDPLGWIITWTNNDKIATFSHNEFAQKTMYIFQITGAKDISGNDLNPSMVPNPWSFTTTGDYVAPQISITSPADNAENVDPDANIEITFSEEIDPLSLTYICTPDLGGWSEIWSNGNTVLTLSHNPFAIATTYSFQVTTAKDISGNNINQGAVLNPWSFTTSGDLIAPQISAIYPADNAVNVEPNSNVQVTFSEVMDTTSIEYICSPDPGGWFISWSDGNKVITLSHNSFEIGTTYTFDILAGKDKAGNDLLSGPVPRSWNFTTVFVNSLIVTPSQVGIPINGTVVLIAQAYDLQDNPLTGITYMWSVNNDLGTISPQGLQIATFSASSNEGICYVNVTAGGKSASALITIKSEDFVEEEPKDSQPEDIPWIWLLILVIIVLCVIILWFALRKEKPEAAKGPGPVDEKAASEERTDDVLEKTDETKPSPPPKPSSDDLEHPPPPRVEEELPPPPPLD
ncbi:MAG: Ig-like domain-containing protein [Thermoplasmata archaeon]|nr:MAG: Ig-like domain-containing protein [Thermoplasmata archaeon]